MGIKSKQPIKITEAALTQLKYLQSQQKKQLCLKLGVKQGGCSGMSYTMNFEELDNVSETDTVIDYEDFTIICDPKSLLYLYGLSLDYNNQLIGGGFKFVNPNATQTCGCGQSFNT